MIATLRLHKSGRTVCLAGLDETTEGVYVLAKLDAETWTLHRIGLDDQTLALRAILSASDSEAAEIAEAVTRATAKPRRSRRTAARRGAR